MAAVSQTIQQYLSVFPVNLIRTNSLVPLKKQSMLTPTLFGLVKRPGTVFNAQLGNSSDLDSAYFFTFNYDDLAEQYIGAVYGQTLKIWNLSTGAQLLF